MYSRKIALSLARQYRTCPPDSIRSLPEYHDEVRRHLEICPYCSEGGDKWEELAARCRQFGAGNAVSNEPVAAGQIRPIRSELGTWKNGFYYNPPLILVLDCWQDKAAVAHVYHDIALAGPGDIILTDAPPPYELFVELWNGYDIRMRMLGEPVFQLSLKTIEDIQQMRSGGIHPVGYKMPRPMAENDPRVFFRAIETDVGRLFALTVRKPMEDRLVEMMAKLKRVTVSEVMDIIKTVAPNARWPKVPQTILQALSLPVLFHLKQASLSGGPSLSGQSPLQWSLDFSEDAVCFSEESSSFPAGLARLFTFVSGQLVDIQLLSVSILQSEAIDGFQAIGGQIHPIPEGIRETDVYVYLQAADQCIDAQVIRLDLQSGSFLVKFSDLTIQDGTLVILMLRSSDGCRAMT